MTRKIKLRVSGRVLKKKRRGTFATKKHCRFCANDQAPLQLDYKNATMLKGFITERGKILPSRISGTCNRHQRHVTSEIKQARVMALLPYTATQ